MPSAAKPTGESGGDMKNAKKSFASRHRTPAIGVALLLATQVLGLRVAMSHGQGRRSDDCAKLLFACPLEGAPFGGGERFLRASYRSVPTHMLPPKLTCPKVFLLRIIWSCPPLVT